jgi:DNA-directed RNA polymerase subunit RPC12/RpoP
MVVDSELTVVVADAAGNQLASHLVDVSVPLRVGQELWLRLGGAQILCRVLREPAGDEGRRTVHVIEIPLRCPSCHGRLLAASGAAGVERDEQGEYATCRPCGRRVAMERLPTSPPGGPGRLRVAAEH